MAGATGSSGLLATKLHIPVTRRRGVPRPRLMQRLQRAESAALTLVSAPAGFGKTTVITEWLSPDPAAAIDGPVVAWLSLDAADNEAPRFWTYLTAALEQAALGAGAEAFALPDDPGSASSTEVVTGLVNTLVARDVEVVLVLDDYHVIESPEIHEAIAFLLEHIPPRMRLVLTTRADPPLPLSRLRARGDLVEIRAADLRFTWDEASVYLREVMNLPLTDTDVSALEVRTEGWIAALQLAALSLQTRDDITDFVRGFAGDDRYVVDFLVEEVLQQQDDRVRDFLLQTSILQRVNAGLCDAVTGRDDGKAMLEALYRGNLFLLPLDDRRGWFRYHQLFAEVLRARLADDGAVDVRELHRRASRWLSAQGDTDAAIGHALAGHDHPLAADLIEAAVPAMGRERREATLRAWMEQLPTGIFAARPVLSLAFAGAILSTGGTEGVEPRLRDAERWLDGPEVDGASRSSSDGHPVELVVVDVEEYRRLPAAAAMYRAGLSMALRDSAAAESHARRALTLLEPDDHFRRGAASALIGLAVWPGGDLDGAFSAYTEASDGLLRAGWIADVLGCAIILADIRVVQGRLGDALAIYEDALRLAGDQPQPVRRGVADMHVGISGILRERGDLTGAALSLAASDALGEGAGLPKHPHRWRTALAELTQVEGDLDEALRLLEEAERLYVSDFAPDVRPVSALKVRAWLRQGELRPALDWVRRGGLRADDELTYLREFEHVTLARVLLAQHTQSRDRSMRDEAIRLLHRLEAAAATAGRNGTLIEVLVLRALADELEGNLPRALSTLEQAIHLARPEGYTRAFLDEGAPMMALLRRALARGVAVAEVESVLAAAGERRERSGPAGPLSHVELAEPLSIREREVLRLLATDLSGPEIARQLVVSVNTVRTHTKSIYAKLGVGSRRAAVRRAQEWGEL